MTSEIKIFRHEEFGEIRTLQKDDVTWFVGRNVASLLGYKKPENALSRHVDREDTLKQGIPDKYGTIQETTLINESGLYSLILSSKLPQAKAFKRWVTTEVLPSIRKHGAYLRDDLLNNPDLLISVIHKLKDEQGKRKELESTIAENKPKLSYLENVLSYKGTIPTTMIAKDYGMSAIEFNRLLFSLGIQYKTRECWLLRQAYAKEGYAKVNTRRINNRLCFSLGWTQKGRLFLYEKLKEVNYQPLIEYEELQEVEA